jgi:hypothetical protein
LKGKLTGRRNRRSLAVAMEVGAAGNGGEADGSGGARASSPSTLPHCLLAAAPRDGEERRGGS